jgi:hypothetical protein
MTLDHCDVCHEPIPAGEAMIRLRSLVRALFHRDCYRPAPAIPTQRQPMNEPARAS